MKFVTFPLFSLGLVLKASASALPERTPFSTNLTFDYGGNPLHPRAQGWAVGSSPFSGFGYWAQPGAQIGGVSRTLSSMSLFLSLGEFSSLRNTLVNVYWTTTTGWKLQELPSWGPWDKTAGTGVAAISRRSTDMEVFYTDAANTIHSHYWVQGYDWREALDRKGSDFTPGCHLTVVSRHEDHMELFYPGKGAHDKSIMHTYITDGQGHWTIDVELIRPGSTFYTYQPPTQVGMGAISLANDRQQLFWITTSGAIQTAIYRADIGWVYLSLFSSAKVAHISSELSVISRNIATINVFFIGTDYKVRNVYWSSNGNTYGNGIVSTTSAQPGSLAAVTTNPDHMEVFWTTIDGTIMHAYWTTSQGKWIEEAMPNANGVKCGPGQSIKAITRKGTAGMDGFCLTKDGKSLVHFVYYP